MKDLKKKIISIMLLLSVLIMSFVLYARADETLIPEETEEVSIEIIMEEETESSGAIEEPVPEEPRMEITEENGTEEETEPAA